MAMVVHKAHRVPSKRHIPIQTNTNTNELLVRAYPTRHHHCTYSTNINIGAKPNIVYDCHCNISAGECAIAMVHRIPSNDTFKFKYASIPTYLLFALIQHDSVPYIQSISTSVQSAQWYVLFHYHCNWTADEYTIAIVYRIPSNDTFKFKHAQRPNSIGWY